MPSLKELFNLTKKLTNDIGEEHDAIMLWIKNNESFDVTCSMGGHPPKPYAAIDASVMDFDSGDFVDLVQKLRCFNVTVTPTIDGEQEYSRINFYTWC